MSKTTEKHTCPDCSGDGLREHPATGPYTCKGCSGHGFVTVPPGWKPIRTYCEEHGVHCCDLGAEAHEGRSA